MKCKDIPDRPILTFIDSVKDKPCSAFGIKIAKDTSVFNAMPIGTHPRLALAKMNMLIRRGLIDGCACGCRGDFTITTKGRHFIALTKQ